MLKTLPVNLIYSSSNVRQENDDTIFELMTDINTNGLLQPIVVREVNDKYEVVAGHRRLLAVKNLGESHIECNVLEDISDKERIRLQLSENLQRKQMSAWELVDAFDSLKEKYNFSDAQIAKFLHKSVGFIADQRYAVRLLNEKYGGEVPDQAKKLAAGVIKTAMSKKKSGNSQTFHCNGFTYTTKGHSIIISCGNYDFENALYAFLKNWDEKNGE
ncbi:MAG: ParB/RepB/Spo0J family partition protein [Bacilli bacterium]|nr:ParB/RepB/Spo0J family partition protein [Bacilli bacterium]